MRLKRKVPKKEIHDNDKKIIVDKAVNEIDQIFDAKVTKPEPVVIKKKKVKIDRDDDFFTNNKSKTVDNLRVFSVNDLKIGQGKDTPDCPFDCECCF